MIVKVCIDDIQLFIDRLQNEDLMGKFESLLTNEELVKFRRITKTITANLWMIAGNDKLKSLYLSLDEQYWCIRTLEEFSATYEPPVHNEQIKEVDIPGELVEDEAIEDDSFKAKDGFIKLRGVFEDSPPQYVHHEDFEGVTKEDIIADIAAIGVAVDTDLYKMKDKCEIFSYLTRLSKEQFSEYWEV